MISERRAVHAGVGTRELFVDGDGPTVVLLHGFGHPADCWRPVLDRLVEIGQSAVAVDLPGFGDADPAEQGAWLPQGDRFVTAVVARHGEHAPVVVVGNSLGSFLAVRAARESLSLPIRGILMTGTPGLGWTPWTRAALIGNGRLITAATALDAPRVIRTRGADWLIGQLLYGDRTTLDPELVRTLSTHVRTRRAARELLTRGVSMKAEVDDQLPIGKITCPTIIVHGRRDRIVAAASSKGWHRAIPHSRLVVIDNAGHCPQLDAPSEIAGYARELATASHGESQPA